MKKVTYAVIIMMSILIVAIAIIFGTSKIQDVTLATDAVEKFNTGWSRVYQDGTCEPIKNIPYYGLVEKNQEVIFENTITTDMCGKTISFLSADKLFKVYVGEQQIYSFGYDDEKMIGHTPGSVMAFVDIPENSAGEKISIVSQSPYSNYAAYFTDVTIGNRDVAILYFIKARMPAFIICFGILVCAIIIIIIGIVQRMSKQPSVKFFCMGFYILIMFFYHMIETKMPMIFYGNQFLYSNLIFLSLMSAPIFLEGYFYVSAGTYKREMRILMIFSFANIGVQIILQFFNICDFLVMVPVSHGILGVLIACVLIRETKITISNRRVDSTYVSILTMSVCGAIDLARNLWVKVGDLGKYSRIGILVMGISLIYTYLRDLAQGQIRLVENQKNEIFSAEIINTLVAAIDAKDIYTKGHSTRVAQYSVILAKALGWSDEQLKDIKYKALLHDVGKIGIPDRVLNKAGRLTDDEYEIIKSHTTMGATILSGVSSLSNMNLVAKNHHERFDGKGYPEGLSGKQIPLEARLVGIADAYDAMSSDRAYRKALPRAVIREELLKGRGTQFDPDMIDVFIELMNDGNLDEVYSKWNGQKRNVDSVAYNSEEYTGVSIVITLHWEQTVTEEEIATAMRAMEYSVKQSLRDVDLLNQSVENSYEIFLVDVHQEDVQMIMDRIFASFYSNSQNQKIKPSYEIAYEK